MQHTPRRAACCPRAVPGGRARGPLQDTIQAKGVQAPLDDRQALARGRLGDALQAHCAVACVWRRHDARQDRVARAPKRGALQASRATGVPQHTELRHCVLVRRQARLLPARSRGRGGGRGGGGQECLGRGGAGHQRQQASRGPRTVRAPGRGAWHRAGVYVPPQPWCPRAPLGLQLCATTPACQFVAYLLPRGAPLSKLGGSVTVSKAPQPPAPFTGKKSHQQTTGTTKAFPKCSPVADM